MTRSMYRRLRALAVVTLVTDAAAQGALENPQPSAVESGIGVISGWHCTAREITVSIDGVSIGKAGSGTLRPDTASVCGGRTDTGFSLLTNFNRTTPGVHRIDVFVDGVLWQSRSYSTVRSGDVEFLAGATRGGVVEDFPQQGKIATLTWSQARQSFVVTAMQTRSQYFAAACSRTEEIRGIWQLVVPEGAPLTTSVRLAGAANAGDDVDAPCVMPGTDEAGRSDAFVFYSPDFARWVIVDDRGEYFDSFVMSMTSATRLDGFYVRLSKPSFAEGPYIPAYGTKTGAAAAPTVRPHGMPAAQVAAATATEQELAMLRKVVKALRRRH